MSAPVAGTDATAAWTPPAPATPAAPAAATPVGVVVSSVSQDFGAVPLAVADEQFNALPLPEMEAAFEPPLPPTAELLELPELPAFALLWPEVPLASPSFQAFALL